MEVAGFDAAPVGTTTGPVVPVPGELMVEEGDAVPDVEPGSPVAVDVERLEPVPVVAVSVETVEAVAAEGVDSLAEGLPDDGMSDAEAVERVDSVTDAAVEGVKVAVVVSEVAVPVWVDSDGVDKLAVGVVSEVLGAEGAEVPVAEASAVAVVVVSGMGTAEVSLDPAP